MSRTHSSRIGPFRSPASVDIRAVSDDQWSDVSWLWQLFRHDLALIVGGLPYADGRYQAAQLDGLPTPDKAG